MIAELKFLRGLLDRLIYLVKAHFLALIVITELKFLRGLWYKSLPIAFGFPLHILICLVYGVCISIARRGCTMLDSLIYMVRPIFKQFMLLEQLLIDNSPRYWSLKHYGKDVAHCSKRGYFPKVATSTKSH